MKRGVRTLSALVLCAVIIIAFYMYLIRAAGQRAQNSQRETGTEMQRLLDIDFDTNYPPTPRTVIKYYNRFSMVCFGANKPTEEETTQLAAQMWKLLDDELAAANQQSDYAASLWAEVQDYEDRDATLIETTVSNTDDIAYRTVSDSNYAYVQTTYIVREAGTYSTTYQMFVLRQDANENWKILGFSRADKDGNPINTTTETN